jgi:hypothetical protein
VRKQEIFEENSRFSDIYKISGPLRKNPANWN